MPAQDKVTVDVSLCKADGSKLNLEFSWYGGVDMVVASTEDQ